MKTISSIFRALGVVFTVSGLCLTMSPVSFAQQTQTQAQSLSDILRRVEQGSRQLSVEDQERLARFRRALDQQEAEMADANRQLRSVTARGNRLSGQFDENQVRIDRLASDLEEQAGDFAQLVGEFRAAVGEVQPLIGESLANFDYPGRVQSLAEVAEASTLPSREELDRLPKAILQEMIAQSEVRTFTSEVSNSGSDGEIETVDLTRVGVFVAATNDGANFVSIEEDVNGNAYLTKLLRQPTGRFRNAMRSLIGADEGGTITVPLDPNKGELFKIEGEKPGFGERINQGGTIGYIVIGLLFFGLGFAVFKMITLYVMGSQIRATARTRRAGDGDPLARVFEVYETSKTADMETLELRLDEQILRESPRIERFNDVIKVLASVAPLMGLLGTVIGMIITFTAITNFGAGDPKLMAGGISVALMTTVLGLVAAIPLLLSHALVAAMARGNQQILDEQAAGLIAERAEQEQPA